MKIFCYCLDDNLMTKNMNSTLGMTQFVSCPPVRLAG